MGLSLPQEVQVIACACLTCVSNGEEGWRVDSRQRGLRATPIWNASLVRLVGRPSCRVDLGTVREGGVQVLSTVPPRESASSLTELNGEDAAESSPGVSSVRNLQTPQRGPVRVADLTQASA